MVNRLPTPMVTQVAPVGKFMSGARAFCADDLPPKAAESFWRRLDQTGDCWEWQGAINQANGYGQMYIGRLRSGRYEKTWIHRVAYVLQVGPIPAGMNVCHHCDNRICGRGDHLFLGTPKANAEDRDAKGRHMGTCLSHPRHCAWHAALCAAVKRGSASAAAKLTEEAVADIRRARRAGATYVDLAQRYRVDPAVVRRAAMGKTWKHVTEEVAS